MAKLSTMKIIDRGWNAIVRNTRRINDSFTKVGLPEGAEIKSGNKSGSGRDPLESMSELVQVAAVHEFGTRKAGRNKNIVIPERPFIRPSFDVNRPQLDQIIDREYEKVLRDTVSVETSLSRIGAWLVGRTQKFIRDMKAPPLSQKTIEKKGSSKLLIDIGQMIQSITHVEEIK